jgi:cysteine desulfurase
VLDACRSLEAAGVEVTRLPVEADGRVDVRAVEAAFGDRTVLVSVMTANNEIGVLQPVEEIGALARRRGVLLHTDASQAVGRVPFDVERASADLVSFTAHKIYGPKGVGALYVRHKGGAVPLAPLLHGGAQERGLRAGTLNVPGIVGFGAAAEIGVRELAAEADRVRALRDRLLAGLRDRLGDVRVNGSLEHRLPHNLNVAFPGAEPETLRVGLDDVAVSFGAACASGTTAPSHVLAALNIPPDLAMTSVRFGLGRWTTVEEIDYAIDKVSRVVDQVRRVGA